MEEGDEEEAAAAREEVYLCTRRAKVRGNREKNDLILCFLKIQ